MKTQFLLIPTIILFIAIAARAQAGPNETIMPVNDIRSLGVEPHDTTLANHRDKEVVVLHTKHFGFVSHDTIEVYQMYFYKMYHSKLKKYDMSETAAVAYDKAAYRWEGDDTIFIRLFNSKASKKGKTWKLNLSGKAVSAFVSDYGDYK